MPDDLLPIGLSAAVEVFVDKMNLAAKGARQFNEIDDALTYYNVHLGENIVGLLKEAIVVGTVGTPAGVGTINPGARLT